MHQYLTDDAFNLLVRTVTSLLRAYSQAHLGLCGRRWVWEDCDAEGFEGLRIGTRVASFFACAQLIGNAACLSLQFCFPQSGISSRTGNRYLFWRGVCQATAAPIQAFRGIFKVAAFGDEREVEDWVVNLIRGFVLIPIASWSLLRQYFTTGYGTASPPPGTQLRFHSPSGRRKANLGVMARHYRRRIGAVTKPVTVDPAEKPAVSKPKRSCWQYVCPWFLWLFWGCVAFVAVSAYHW
mmetsp:Transcript_35311/g.74825  ORF Transcript_35311/g.74825 Transcript_35311/m.74825 type:complete len:238 (-) Transcript_35311:103-816(-)